MRILVADTLAKEGLDYLKQTGIDFDEKIGLKEPELAAIPSGQANAKHPSASSSFMRATVSAGRFSVNAEVGSG